MSSTLRIMVVWFQPLPLIISRPLVHRERLCLKPPPLLLHTPLCCCNVYDTRRDWTGVYVTLNHTRGT
jgi:hypothetical protein